MLLGIAGSAPAFGWTPLPGGAPDEAGSYEEGANAQQPGGSGPRALAAVLPVLQAAALVTGAPPARAAALPQGPPTAPRTPPTVTTSLFAPHRRASPSRAHPRSRPPTGR